MLCTIENFSSVQGIYSSILNSDYLLPSLLIIFASLFYFYGLLAARHLALKLNKGRIYFLGGISVLISVILPIAVGLYFSQFLTDIVSTIQVQGTVLFLHFLLLFFLNGIYSNLVEPKEYKNDYIGRLKKKFLSDNSAVFMVTTTLSFVNGLLFAIILLGNAADCGQMFIAKLISLLFFILGSGFVVLNCNVESGEIKVHLKGSEGKSAPLQGRFISNLDGFTKVKNEQKTFFIPEENIQYVEADN